MKKFFITNKLLIKCSLVLFICVNMTSCGIFPTATSCYSPTQCAKLKDNIWGNWQSLYFLDPKVYISYNSNYCDVYIYRTSHPSDYDMKITIYKNTAVKDKNGTSYNGKFYVKEDYRLGSYRCFPTTELTLPVPITLYGPGNDVNITLRGDKNFSKSMEKGGLYGVLSLFFGNGEGVAFYFGPQ